MSNSKKMTNRLAAAIAIIAACAAGAASAGVTNYSGNLGDNTNAALVGSDLLAAQFGTPNDIANNVALYTFHVGTAGNVSFVSTGFAAGGIDPYFSLFDAATSTFIDSNYLQAFSVGGDFNISENLIVGDYTLALSTFANMSFAENLGAGLLSDGFISLGDPNSLGDGSYFLTVTTPDADGGGGGGGGGGSVPEPSALALVAVALSAAAVARSRNKR